MNEQFATDTARRFGYARAETTWQAVADADDIDVVSVVVANHLHREVVEALLAAGKHVLCEKPFAPTIAEAESMVAAARADLDYAGVTARLEVVLADAGYWHQIQMQRLMSDGLQVLIPPDANKRKGERPGRQGGLYDFMRRVLATDRGGELYARRQTMVEPVFAHTKFNRRCDRFLRRGRSACRSEWRLINATHNLLKLYKHTIAPAAALPARGFPCALATRADSTWATSARRQSYATACAMRSGPRQARALRAAGPRTSGSDAATRRRLVTGVSGVVCDSQISIAIASGPSSREMNCDVEKPSTAPRGSPRKISMM